MVLFRVGLVLALLIVPPLAAQGPAYLVKDIDPLDSQGSSNADGFVQVGAFVYFAADGNLWRTDGTTAGTEKVSDILAVTPATNDNYGASFAEFGGELFFPGGDSTLDIELWKSDGTAPGTVLAADMAPGEFFGGYPGNLFVANGLLYFTGYHNTVGYHPWVSDGTAAGTQMLQIYGNGSSVGPQSFWILELNGLVYFNAVGFTGGVIGGVDVWRSDGTLPGTFRLTQLGSVGTEAVVVGSTMYFAALTAADGRELWKSDGTIAGTVLVKDAQNGGADTNPVGLTALGGHVYFIAEDLDSLWKSDGTEAGTVEVASFANIFPRSLVASNGNVYFGCDIDTDPAVRYLCRSDGTPAGTGPLVELVSYLRDLTAVDGLVYFTAWQPGGTSGELWVSDGTAAGTQVVDIHLGPQGSTPSDLTVAMGRLFFNADDGLSGREPWVHDGTTAFLLKDIVELPDASGPSLFTDIAGTMMFVSSDSQNPQVWRSDGTSVGTFPVTGQASTGVAPSELRVVGSSVFFAAGDPLPGNLEIFESDGTGSLLFAEINPLTDGSDPTGFTEFGGELFVAADGGTYGQELWGSFGGLAGMALVKDIALGGASSSVSSLTVSSGSLFFAADDGTNGRELWISDGTDLGTLMVKDIIAGATGSEPRDLVGVSGTLFFTADDGANGRELWKSDGSASGTTMVKDVVAGVGSSEPMDLVALGAFVYFTADDGNNGRELWKSDGSAPGTVLVDDIRAGVAGSAPSELCVVAGQLFFNADDGTAGRELWKSDGTTVGTVQIADVRPGPVGSSPRGIRQIDSTGLTLFFADDGVVGTELWKTDGTDAGTGLVQDMWPGPGPGGGTDIGVSGNTAFFNAHDGVTGFELWALPLFGPGSVPRDASQGGAPLALTKATAGELTLTWGDGTCAATATDYAVYEGLLGDFTSHVIRTCSTSTSTTTTFGPAGGDRYYIVVPRNATAEGSYGLDGSRTDRPPAAVACVPQNLGPGCP